MSYDLTTPGVAIDTVTGLWWQRELVGRVEWAAAAKFCEELSLGGRDDWRLPTRIEMVSITDFSRYPSFNDTAFPGIPLEGEYYWTASIFNKDLVWAVASTGATLPIGSGSNRVRCVR